MIVYLSPINASLGPTYHPVDMDEWQVQIGHTIRHPAYGMWPMIIQDIIHSWEEDGEPRTVLIVGGPMNHEKSRAVR